MSAGANGVRRNLFGEPIISTLAADPPWLFDDDLPGEGRGAAKHYPCMSLAELIAFQRTWRFELAVDAYLLLWRVASMQMEALMLASAWGFTVKTELVWIKRTSSGKRWFGMGRTLRAEHEVCIVASRGNPKPLNLSTRTTFKGVAEGHSSKPCTFYSLCEGTFPAPRVELFARRRREGWLQFGNELPIENSAPVGAPSLAAAGE